MLGGEVATISELRKISRLLTLAYSERIEAELSKIASTDERKKMWVLVDGKNMPKDIARAAGVKSDRAVNYFLSQAASAGFVSNPPRIPPVRSIDYVPPTWLALLEPEPTEPNTAAESTAESPVVQEPSPPDQKKLDEVH